MPKREFITPEGERVEDDAVEIEPTAIHCEDLIVWEYDDPDLALRRVILDPYGVKLWKAVNVRDRQGYPLVSFEPCFEAEPREDLAEDNDRNGFPEGP